MLELNLLCTHEKEIADDNGYSNTQKAAKCMHATSKACGIEENDRLNPFPQDGKEYQEEYAPMGEECSCLFKVLSHPALKMGAYLSLLNHPQYHGCQKERSDKHGDALKKL